MRKATNFSDDFYIFLAENDPQTFTKAMISRDALQWKETINNALNSIMSNRV